MFSGVDKMIAAFLGPFLVKIINWAAGLTALVPTLTPEVEAWVMAAATSVITGLWVYFQPNKQ